MTGSETEQLTHRIGRPAQARRLWLSPRRSGPRIQDDLSSDHPVRPFSDPLHLRSPHIRSVFSVPLKGRKEDRHLHDDDLTFFAYLLCHAGRRLISVLSLPQMVSTAGIAVWVQVLQHGRRHMVCRLHLCGVDASHAIPTRRKRHGSTQDHLPRPWNADFFFFFFWSISKKKKKKRAGLEPLSHQFIHLFLSFNLLCLANATGPYQTAGLRCRRTVPQDTLTGSFHGRERGHPEPPQQMHHL